MVLLSSISDSIAVAHPILLPLRLFLSCLTDGCIIAYAILESIAGVFVKNSSGS